jgi:hypothetical protein
MESEYDIRSQLVTFTFVVPLLCILWSMMNIWIYDYNQEDAKDEIE